MEPGFNRSEFIKGGDNSGHRLLRTWIRREY